jgi:hypothetical protein
MKLQKAKQYDGQIVLPPLKIWATMYSHVDLSTILLDLQSSEVEYSRSGRWKRGLHISAI